MNLKFEKMLTQNTLTRLTVFLLWKFVEVLLSIKIMVFEKIGKVYLRVNYTVTFQINLCVVIFGKEAVFSNISTHFVLDSLQKLLWHINFLLKSVEFIFDGFQWKSWKSTYLKMPYISMKQKMKHLIKNINILSFMEDK